MAKSRKPKPSFDGPGESEGSADTGWVYRTERLIESATPSPATIAEPPVVAVAPVVPATPVILEAPAPVPAAAPLAQAPVPVPYALAKRADQIVERYTAVAAAASLLPVPVIDAAAISAVQLTMVRALAAHYSVPFHRDRGKALVTAILGGILPVASGPGVVRFVLGLVPGAGPLVALATLPALGGGVTYAVGQAFASHFAAGGTLEDLDVERSRRSVAQAVARA
jgi:uncharacterized protein (DUF697 family)